MKTKNIKKYRKLKHMSQRQLAIKSGYSYSYIKKLENETDINKRIKLLNLLVKLYLLKDMIMVLQETL